jgi:menaquinone-specific isochorismate synthase
MNPSLPLLHEWMGSDFWNLGAFITSLDDESVSLGKGGSVEVVKHFLPTDEPVFYLKNFFENTYLAYRPQAFARVPKSEFLSWSATLKNEDFPLITVSNDDELYEKDFFHLKDSMTSKLEKVVLVSRETYEGFGGEESIKKFLKKAFHFGTGTPYGMWNQDYGVIGSTPEVLFHLEDLTLKTFALAGTAKIGEEERLLQSLKERHEHELVVQDICEKLSPFVKDLTVQETRLHHFKNLIHLKTEIQGVISLNSDLTNLTNTLSPTAALGGYPLDESMAFLKKTLYSKKYPLRYFGSAFGLVSSSTKDFLVSIRNVQWQKGFVFIESGGGVVVESQLQRELEEIHLKRQTIKNYYL